MLEFRLLGALAAESSKGPIRLGSGKQLALLAYLLLRRNEAIPRETLIDTLWADDPPPSAAHALDVYLSRLRKALPNEGTLETQRGTVRLNVPDDAVDVARFERALADARRASDADARLAAAEEALAMWRGRALAGVGDEPFLRVERERLEEERQLATEERLAALLDLGRHDETIAELQTLIAAQPLRERPRRLCMLALYRAGRQGEALELYREGHRILGEELGLEPSRELRELEAAILRQDASLDAPDRGGARHVRSELPSGTVTFLFTDVDESTRLLRELGDEGYAGALAGHRRSVREACARFGGVEVDTQGDAFFLAFPTASGALEAARAITEELSSGPISVRMGLHTGQPLVTDEGYVGADVHRAARIAAAGHGGQVLVSSSTAALVETALRDLGEHRFKDLVAPERVFQVGDGEFPPLRSLRNVRLPVPATPFLGREEELATVVGMLGEPNVRLVSLVGPGGTGKTRLALQAAAETSDAYPDGVFWAPLAPLRDPALVLPAVAAALSVIEGKDNSPVDDLARALAGRRLLVFVDNIEHLMPDAADLVGAFVEACPTVTTVVTTRERLQLPGEHVYAVPPMSETDGEALFRIRAAAVGVELKASEELRKLCARLDNLPLALELAAARAVVFSPAQLLDRLSQRLDLLKAGRGVDARQQTLRSTIAWSHDLLDADEQALFRRLSLFAGGCGLESAEQVAGADPDVLQSLLDKSLLRRRDGTLGPRFWMLETIREFAAEQLTAAGEADDLKRRHLDHFSALAHDSFDETLLGNDDLGRLEEERENLRVAFDLALEIEPRLALELGRRLMASWMRRGDFREGRERLSAALIRAPDAPGLARAWALRNAAVLASQQSDLEVADSLGYQALALFRGLGDQRGVGWTLHVLGWNATARGAYDEARRLYEEAGDAHSGPGDEQPQRRVLMALANLESLQGDHARAVSMLHDVVASTRRKGSTHEMAFALGNLGVAQDVAGETEQGRRSLEESIALSRLDGRKPGLAVGLCNLGYLLRPGAPDEALAHFRESLALSREIEEPRTITYSLEGVASILAARGNAANATTLLATASGIRALTGAVSSPQRRANADNLVAHCREALTPDAFARAWEEGVALDANAAADWALRLLDEGE